MMAPEGGDVLIGDVSQFASSDLDGYQMLQMIIIESA
jgi:hypothetical protein